MQLVRELPGIQFINKMGLNEKKTMRFKNIDITMVLYLLLKTYPNLAIMFICMVINYTGKFFINYHSYYLNSFLQWSPHKTENIFLDYKNT